MPEPVQNQGTCVAHTKNSNCCARIRGTLERVMVRHCPGKMSLWVKGSMALKASWCFILAYSLLTFAITNHHKLRGLKQHKPIILQFWMLRVKWVSVESNPGVSRAYAGSRGESILACSSFQRLPTFLVPWWHHLNFHFHCHITVYLSHFDPPASFFKEERRIYLFIHLFGWVESWSWHARMWDLLLQQPGFSLTGLVAPWHVGS